MLSLSGKWQKGHEDARLEAGRVGGLEGGGWEG